jgi:hypothetical protein
MAVPITAVTAIAVKIDLVISPTFPAISLAKLRNHP